MRTTKNTTISILAVGLLAGSAVGVAAQDEEAMGASTPVYVTWTAGEPTSTIDGTFDEEAGELRGLVVQGAPVEASDPRLSGLYYFAANGNVQSGGTPDYGAVESRSWRMENAGGAWTGTSVYVEVGNGSADGPPAMVAESGVFIGEGGYEGLIAVLDSDYPEGNGGDAVILELSVPPIPEAPELPAE